MTRLFEDYLSRQPGLLSLYAGDWGKEEDWRIAAERALAYEGPRAAVLDALHSRNDERLTGEGRERLQAVAEGRGVAVVGGQQTGIATGPLYTIHKATSLLRLASWVEETLSIPTLPVFWAASNDSDLEEAGAFTILDRQHELQRFSLAESPEMDAFRGWPVGRIPLGPASERIIRFVTDLLDDSEFAADLLEDLRSTYRPEQTVGGAFVSLMGRWFGPLGLVLIDPTWPELRRPSTDLYARVMEDPRSAEESLAESARQLKSDGYHRQLTIPANRLPLFATRESEPRRPLIPTGEKAPSPIEVEGSGTVGADELLDPEGSWELDPHAVLRPILQDHLLPTIAFVGGPAEIAYFAQLGGLYDRLGVPRPIAMPRARVMLVSRAAGHVLEKHGLEAEAFAEGPGSAANQLARSRFPGDLESAFDEASSQIATSIEDLKERLVEMDPDLARPSDTSAGRMQSELRKLKEKAIAGSRRTEETLQAQLEKAAAWLYPGGSEQERVLNITPFLVRYGTQKLLSLLLEHTDPRRPESVQKIIL